ncbi:MAG: helix-turn-helix transcriptional regulator [Megamonas funiformis]|jgi:transcriptional regulator with XRE-family HTH domain|uniref:helix-turn-helix domain-containing protein n=1 Tax=Megamonas funiformis TaxID=437897 RepID=UPI001EC96493|nr:helix-turn-helix transcriptional regulator [Megamonas funiformis]MBS7213074.1 helix-turn-helix transcriptional regulator [Megamonas funiformis]
MKLGIHLKQLRQNKNLSQNDLSILSKVPQTTISNIERDICSPTIDTLRKLSKALNIKISDLLE